MKKVIAALGAIAALVGAVAGIIEIIQYLNGGHAVDPTPTITTTSAEPTTCLVGQWSLTKATIGSGPETRAYSGGTFVLTLDPDGSGRVELTNYQEYFTAQRDTQNVVNGLVEFRYTVSADNLTYRIDHVAGSVTHYYNGVQVGRESLQWAADPEKFSCTEEHLETYTSNYQQDYARVRV